MCFKTEIQYYMLVVILNVLTLTFGYDFETEFSMWSNSFIHGR